MLRRGGGSQRLLTTVLFTDIVGSTERAAELGDRGWKTLVARHHAIVRHDLHRFHGRELDTAGDGFFASFERPAQAIECATAIVDDLRPLDLRIRAAIHMGEAEVMGGKVGGITVHVASRALAEARPDEVLVTSTVREVAAGADVTFSDRGVHEFKGVPEDWHLYAVEWRRREIAPAAPVTGTVASPEAGARRRTRWVLTLGAALVGVAVVAVATYALLPHGSATPPPNPQPDSALHFDAASNGLVAVVPIGGTPTGVAIGGDTVWVLSQGNKTLYPIPAAGGSPVPRGLPGAPTAIAADGDAAWITLGYGASGAGGGVVLRVPVAPAEPDKIPIDTGANAIAADRTAVWVTNGAANTLTKIDPVTRSPAKTVKVAEQPVAVATGLGSVWVAHAVGRSVWRIDPQTMTKLDEVSLREPATDIAVGAGRVWVTSDVGRTVTVIDAATMNVTSIPLDLAPRGIAVGSDAVWVACGQDALLRIDPASPKASPPIELPGPAWDVDVSGTAVWVTVQR